MLRLPLLATLLVPILTAGCDSTECGTGTMLMDGKCIPTGGVVTCGVGTMLVGGECRPDGTIVTCAKGTMLTNGQCVPSAEACGSGTMLDATGVCIPIEGIQCGEGTVLMGTICELDPAVCRGGTVFDEAMGGCVGTPTCRTGEVVVGGICLTPEEIDASMADVTESVPDDNDPGFGGAPEALPTPDIGTSVIFTGTIQDPIDLDGDFTPDQDWDYLSFSAESGDTFEIVLRSLGSNELGFVVAGPNGYRRMSPLYFRPEPSRHIVVPYAGTYTIAIAPQIAIERVTDGGPAGGDDYTYVLVLEHEAFPTASDVALGATAAGNFDDLTNNLHRVVSTAGDLFRVEFGPVGRDARPILMTFDAGADFVAELDELPADGIVHRAGTNGDLLLLMD